MGQIIKFKPSCHCTLRAILKKQTLNKFLFCYYRKPNIGLQNRVLQNRTNCSFCWEPKGLCILPLNYQDLSITKRRRLSLERFWC